MEKWPRLAFGLRAAIAASLSRVIALLDEPTRTKLAKAFEFVTAVDRFQQELISKPREAYGACGRKADCPKELQSADHESGDSNGETEDKASGVDEDQRDHQDQTRDLDGAKALERSHETYYGTCLPMTRCSDCRRRNELRWKSQLGQPVCSEGSVTASAVRGRNQPLQHPRIRRSAWRGPRRALRFSNPERKLVVCSSRTWWWAAT